MIRVISAKKEISTLLYDIKQGLETGTSCETLLTAAQNKLAKLIEHSERDYLSVRWEK